MKTWKIITAVGIALVAIALTTASAFAYMGGRGIYQSYGVDAGTQNPYGPYPSGMMGGRQMGGTMGYGAYSGYVEGYAPCYGFYNAAAACPYWTNNTGGVSCCGYCTPP